MLGRPPNFGCNFVLCTQTWPTCKDPPVHCFVRPIYSAEKSRDALFRYVLTHKPWTVAHLLLNKCTQCHCLSTLSITLSAFFLFSPKVLNWLWAVVTKALIKFVRSETATRAVVPTDKWCSTSYHRSAVTTSVSCTVSDILSLVWRTWMFVDDLD